MQIKVSYPKQTEALITINADSQALKSIKDHVLLEYSRSAKISGFRTGKAPLALVEKNIDQSVFQSKFIETAIEQLYFQAVVNEKLRIVSNPQISLKKFVPYTMLEFEVLVPVINGIELPDYTKMKLTKDKSQVTTKDINQVVKNLQLRAAERKLLQRGAKEGDEVIIDFNGQDFKTKEPINGADGKDYALLIGSNTFIPGFESNLVGLKAGEAKEFTLTFPANYEPQALASKKVKFKVHISKVQELLLPELDNDFAKSVGNFNDIQQLKDDIKRQLEAERQREVDNNYEANVVKQIVDKSELLIPDILIENQIDQIENEERQNIIYRGQTWQEHLLLEGVTAEQHRELKRTVATERVKTSLVLTEIAQKEAISVSPEEVEIRIKLLKNQYKDQKLQSELDKQENRLEIENRLITEKTLDKLIRYAS